MKPEDNSLESGYESSQYDPSLDDQSIKVNSQLSVNNRRHIALSLFKFDRKATLISVAVVILIILIGGGVFLFFKNNSQLSLNNQQPNNLYKVGSNLSVTQASSSQILRLGQSSQLAINGQLTVNKNLVLTPSTLPVSPIIGEIYYDKSSNKPFYYNGSKFISLVSTVSPQTLARQAVTSLGGVAGAIGIGSGLLFNGNTLSISNLLIQSIDSSAAAITGGSLSGGNLSSTNLQFTGSSGTINESGNNTNLTINSMGSGILSLDSTGLGTVDVGNTNASAVNIGNNSSASLLEGRSVSIQSGAGGLSLATGSSSGNLYLKTNNSSSGIIAQSMSNSATAFQIQNASGTSLLTADTSNNRIDIGTIGTPTGQLYVSGTIPTYVGENTDTNMNGPTSTYIQGNYVYVTSPYSNKLVVYNISNPSNPTYVGENSDSNLDKPWDVYVQGNYAYVINSNNNNLVVYNISNPSNPTYVGKNASNNGPSSVYVQGNYAYVTSYKSNKLVVYNISNPSNPTYVGENSDSNLNGPVSVVVQGIYAYVTSYNSNKLVVYNISNPSNPTYVGENSDSNLNGPNYVYVQGNYAYVTSYNSNKLVVYNIGGAYIQQLQTGGIQTSNLNVLGNSNLNGDLGIQGGLSVGTNAEINNSLGVGGSATFQDATNSATAFQVQNASGDNVFNVNTNTGITSSISEVNGWSSSGTNNSTLSDSPAALGDLVVLAIKYGNTAVNVTGISGGGVTNWHLVTSGSSTANSTSESLWEGTVSSIGPSTISVNFSSSTGTLNDIDAQEFSSGLGLNTSWSVESSGFLPTTTASTTSSLPLLTAQASNELYWGYIQSSSTVTGLSTSGFNITIDSQGNAMVYNTSTVSNTSYQPVVTLNSSGTSNAISMIISASGISQGVNVSGNFLVQSTVNEATAFQVQNASGVNLLSVDTSSDMINIHGALNFNQSSDVASIDLNHSPVLNVNVNLANTSLGSSTLQSDTSGSSNSALGLSALSSNTTGNENSAVGRAALLNNTTGNGNSAVGLWSLINNATGNGNSAVGFWSLVNNSTGSENSAVGSFALDSINSGSNNSALGFEAGFRDVGGNFATLSNIQNATAIGAYAQVQENNAIVLGSVDNPTLVGIGTTVPLNTFSVSPLDYNTGTASQVSGSDVVTGTGTTWTSSMVGDELIFADGTQELITGFTSATSLTGSSTSISETNSYYRLHYIGLQVTNTGNVGIGTSNPNYNLDIQGTSGEMIQTTTNTDTAFQVQNAAGVSILDVSTNLYQQLSYPLTCICYLKTDVM